VLPAAGSSRPLTISDLRLEYHGRSPGALPLLLSRLRPASYQVRAKRFTVLVRPNEVRLMPVTARIVYRRPG